MNCEKCGKKMVIISSELGVMIYCPWCMPDGDKIFSEQESQIRFLSGLECELCILHDEKRLPKELEEFMKPILRKRNTLRELAKERK